MRSACHDSCRAGSGCFLKARARAAFPKPSPISGSDQGPNILYFSLDIALGIGTLGVGERMNTISRPYRGSKLSRVRKDASRCWNSSVNPGTLHFGDISVLQLPGEKIPS